jgi:hypothetical protein
MAGATVVAFTNTVDATPLLKPAPEKIDTNSAGTQDSIGVYCRELPRLCH